MKAMILAAGRGERLRPLTDRVPKPLAPVAGRPLLAHQLGWLTAAGIHDVVINLHHLGAHIEAAFGDGGAFGVRIRYSHEAERLETGGGIVQALPLLGAEPFLVLNGDIYTDLPFATLRDALPADADAHLVLTPTPPVREQGDFEYADGRVTARGGAYVYCGISILRPELFAGRRAEPFSLRDLLFAAIDRGRVSAQVWAGYWTDIGTPDQLAAVDAFARSHHWAHHLAHQSE
jgi:N-acetyl-alpha-D-muramate 1-phosphate uridylyltransferase